MRLDQLIGSKIDNKYLVVSRLGAGGLGTVYKAEQEDLGRTVAIKVMQLSALGDDELLARFQQEARVLADLEHANIVRVFSYGQLQDGSPYMAMEYLQGQTLDSLLKSQPDISWKRILRIFIQVCRAADFVHSCGIIHRDLKPQNIMILSSNSNTSEQAKILDFGLSRVRFDGQALQALTKTGTILGSVHYMSPEVCQGQKADQRSDVYSLGCCLYECLSGRTVAVSDNPISVISKQVSEMPPPLLSIVNSSKLPEELELVVFKSLQKDPQDRFQSMGEFADALTLVLEGDTESLSLGKVKISKAAKSHESKHKKTLLLLALVSLFILLPFALLFTAHKKQKQPEQTVAKSTNTLANKQERARKLMDKARAVFKVGKTQRAAMEAKRAVMLIAYPMPAHEMNRQSAQATLEILKPASEILKLSGNATDYDPNQTDPLLKLSAHLPLEKRSQYLASLATITAYSADIKHSFFIARLAAEVLAQAGRAKDLEILYADLKQAYKVDTEPESEIACLSTFTIGIVESYKIALNQGKESGQKYLYEKLIPQTKTMLPKLVEKRRWEIHRTLAELAAYLELEKLCEEELLAEVESAIKNDKSYSGQAHGSTAELVHFYLKRNRFDDAIAAWKRLIAKAPKLYEPEIYVKEAEKEIAKLQEKKAEHMRAAGH